MWKNTMSAGRPASLYVLEGAGGYKPVYNGNQKIGDGIVRVAPGGGVRVDYTPLGSRKSISRFGALGEGTDLLIGAAREAAFAD
jgi:hypothetical protein